MSEPQSVSASNSASRYGIVMPDTPEHSIGESLTEVTRELENYKSHMRDGDPAAAQQAIDRAERRLPAAPAAASAAPLRAAVAELRGFLQPNADAAAAEVSEARQNTTRRAPSLGGAVRAFARSGSTRALMNHFGSTPRAAMQRLATVDHAQLKTQLVDAGATRDQASEMIDQLGHDAAFRFHGMAVGQARIQVRNAANEFRDIARGQGLDEMATRLLGGEGRQLLDQMRAGDIDMEGVDAALASGDVEALAAELSPALTQLSHKLNELRTELGQNSSLSGALYINSPGAARVAAQNAGLDPNVVGGQPDGSVLGGAVANHASDAIEAQNGARSWLANTLSVMPVLGGLTSPIAVAVAVAEAGTTNAMGERTNLAATAGLASAEEASETAERAEHSTRDAFVASAVAVSAEVLAHGLGHAFEHQLAHKVGQAMASGSGNLATGAAEQVLHNGAHAVEHAVLGDH